MLSVTVLLLLFLCLLSVVSLSIKASRSGSSVSSSSSVLSAASGQNSTSIGRTGWLQEGEVGHSVMIHHLHALCTKCFQFQLLNPTEDTSPRKVTCWLTFVLLFQRQQKTFEIAGVAKCLYACVSMQMLGGLGVSSPRKFCKLDALRVLLRSLWPKAALQLSLLSLHLCTSCEGSKLLSFQCWVL